MADVPNNLQNSYYQKQNHISLPKSEVTKSFVLDAAVQRGAARGRSIAGARRSSAYAVSSTDRIMAVGSSDVAVFLNSTWAGAGMHTWPNVFRTNYTGLATPLFDQNHLRTGIVGTYQLSRQSLPAILDLARAGTATFAANINPFTAMADYEALIIDAVDNDAGYGNYYPRPAGYIGGPTHPQPYQWGGGKSNQSSHQHVLNTELLARMELIRLAELNGVQRVYLMAAWPRLVSNAPTNVSGVDDPADDRWYFERALRVEQSMNYQFDRLQHQIDVEGLNISLALLPFNLVHQRTYEAHRDGVAPAGITGIRSIWSNGGGGGDPTATNVEKDRYMQNYIGAYAINCIYSATVLGLDPRLAPLTDGTWTVSQAIATFYQDLAIEIRDTVARVGAGGTAAGYTMPAITDRAPEAIQASDLMIRAVSPAGGFNAPLIITGRPKHMLAVIDVDTSLGTNPYQTVIKLHDNANNGFNRANIDFEIRADLSPYFYSAAAGSANQYTPNTVVRMTTAGVKRFVLDVEFAAVGHTTTYNNLTNMLGCIDTSLPATAPNRMVAGGNDGINGTDSPNCNQLSVFSYPGITVREVVAYREYLTDQNRLDLLNRWGRDYSMDVWEPRMPIAPAP
jgi:hypothetical protein